MKLSYLDCCLSDYFNGHHLPTMAIPVTNETTFRDIQDNIISDYNSDMGYYPDCDIKTLANDVFSPIWSGAFPGRSMESPAFPGLEETDDDSDILVYCYFVFEE